MSSFTSKTYTMSIFPLKTESGYSTEDFVCADKFKVPIKKRMKINIFFFMIHLFLEIDYCRRGILF